MFSKEELEMIQAIWDLGIECSKEDALNTYIEIICKATEK